MIPYYYDKKMNIYKNHVEATKSGNHCWLYYGDDFFNKVDWKTEPLLTLEELYRLRAEEIRQNYEYVILCLSGGIDSITVLNTFYKNKIHIDEIITVGAFSQDLFTGSDENNNAEIHHNTKAALHDKHLPDTKIRFIDYTNWFNDINNFSILKNYSDEWALHTGMFKSVHQFFWIDIKKYVPDHSKKTCMIFGTGKTRLFTFPVSNIVFVDYDIEGYCREYKQGHLHRENFYFGITPIGAEIMKKQGHIMMRVRDKLNNDIIFHKNYIRLYNQVIYDKSLLNIPTKKSTTRLLSIRDKFIKRKTDSDIYKIYVGGLNKLKQSIGLDYPGYVSRPYFLKEA